MGTFGNKKTRGSKKESQNESVLVNYYNKILRQLLEEAHNTRFENPEACGRILFEAVRVVMEKIYFLHTGKKPPQDVHKLREYVQKELRADNLSFDSLVEDRLKIVIDRGSSSDRFTEAEIQRFYPATIELIQALEQTEKAD